MTFHIFYIWNMVLYIVITISYINEMKRKYEIYLPDLRLSLECWRPRTARRPEQWPLAQRPDQIQAEK